MSSSVDRSTLSSYQHVVVEHAMLDLKIDWDAQVIRGAVTYSLSSDQPTVVLDTSFLEISGVQWDGKSVAWEYGERKEPLGSPLIVSDLPVGPQNAGKLTVAFATTEKCTGLQWLAPEQTLGKKAPYLFSQCEPTHARSIFPSFDTPAVKIPMRFEIDSKYPVLVSGVKINDRTFEQKIPIPAYLFAIASGNIVPRRIGPRSHVWAEPEFVDACQWEFEADTEKQLSAAESLVFPYEWGTYDILVLPPSFPFGGMENPNVTFATPTLISGDRTLVNVIAHELAHSWSGNLVSNSSWGNFWLNEGWTVYIERRILGKLHGEEYRHFSAIEGWQDLEDAVARMPAPYTKLVMDLDASVDPDDTFSTVPYEKGSTFLWYLENLVGREAWDAFVPKYFAKFKYRSLDSQDFKDTLYDNFPRDTLDKVDWQLWLHTPGLPPKPDFNDELAVPCEKLAGKWLDPQFIASRSWEHGKAAKEDVSNWHPLQMIVFLNTVIEGVQKFDQDKKPTNLADMAAAIGSIYDITASNNAEIKFRWLSLAVSAGVMTQRNELAAWLGTVGRMKYVRPGYKLLLSVDRELAVSTFKKNAGFYHAICRAMVEKDLGLSK